MSCSASFTISPYGGDTPLDQAVYSATQDKIYGVRGGYVHEFNATTGALIQSSRYACPGFSEASIAYDTVNNKIFCSVWDDYAFENDGDARYDIIVSRKLFRLFPATLAVETSAEINGVGGFPGYVGATYESGFIGPHRILYYNGVLYCASGNSTLGSKLCAINVSTLAVATNGQALTWNQGKWIDFCVQPAGAEPMQIWTVLPFYEVYPCASPALTYAASNYYAYDATHYGASFNIIYGVCWCPSNGKIYGTCRKPTVVTFTPNTAIHAFPVSTIATGDANATPYRIAYNSNDGLIYVPGYKSNNVVIIDPATDTVVETQSGFDSPFDVVFTPTKKWAVQQGAIGLKEIV